MSNRFGAFIPDSILSSGIKFKLGHVERVFNDSFDLSSYNKSYEKTFTYASQVVEFSPYSKSSKSNRRKRKKLGIPMFRGFSDAITHGDLILYCNVDDKSFYIGPVNTNNNPNYSADHVYMNDELDDMKDSDGYNKLVPRVSIPKVESKTNKDLDDPNQKTAEFDGSLVDYESRVSDLIIEGRYNNHIRIGNRNVSPLISINNGSNTNQTYVGSTIFMSSLGGIDDHFDTETPSKRNDETILNTFMLSCDNDNPPTEDYMQKWKIGMGNDDLNDERGFDYDYGPTLKRIPPENRNDIEYEPKHQIFITSERIVFDAYGDGHLTLSSMKNINLGAGKNFTLTNKGFTVIQSKNIYLGEEAKKRTQPMVLGNELNNLLKDIMDIIQSAHALVQGVPVPLVDSGGAVLLPKINEIIKKLDVQFEKNYNEGIPEGDRITGTSYWSHHHFIEPNLENTNRTT